ncbi:LytR C-terminal domain-containing protein [Microterricola pindariensis]|uniref:LytR/CpsA/Psr regulator C-terminal domain-containing protein n=1 Tax=Microterricola pindariensis TaxID=478010 RepID=A0ABX5AZG5_9MICO|nr:LytR C-terminal domain-containing protein [Microterricola pindariensis]PPL19714.1 hypothetical protein GY24_04410 [Microterricola pindariensis]
MATSFQHDRFDEIPSNLQRVGAHRVPRKRGRGWVAFAWAALATVVLVGAGVVALFVLNGNLANGTGPAASPQSSEPAPVESEVPAVQPTVDPALAVTVLNGTERAGLAAAAGDTLAAAGWNVTTRSNAATEDVAVSTVYYSDPSLEGAALGAALSIPGAGIALSQDFVDLGEASLVVVIGANYPAIDEPAE